MHKCHIMERFYLRKFKTKKLGAFPIVKLEDEEKVEQPFQDHPTNGKPLNKCNIIGAERYFEITIMISYIVGAKLCKF